MERAAEAVRIEKERKESRLRANKERLAQLQATWKEDQQLKEVWLHSSIKALSFTPAMLDGKPSFLYHTRLTRLYRGDQGHVCMRCLTVQLGSMTKLLLAMLQHCMYSHGLCRTLVKELWACCGSALT